MKTSRLDTRITPEQRTLYERATRLGNYSSMTEFLTDAATRQAREIIKHNEQLIMSKKDMAFFINLLIDPPKPNEALRHAVQEHNESL